jgi:hypothetical protein
VRQSVGVFFIGIGLALVKQLVGVDIGFAPLAVRWPPSTTEVGAFFLALTYLSCYISYQLGGNFGLLLPS